MPGGIERIARLLHIQRRLAELAEVRSAERVEATRAALASVTDCGPDPAALADLLGDARLREARKLAARMAEQDADHRECRQTSATAQARCRAADAWMSEQRRENARSDEERSIADVAEVRMLGRLRRPEDDKREHGSQD